MVARIAQIAWPVLLLAACGAQGDEPGGNLIETGKSAVRVIHLSADGPTVDVFVDDGAEPAVKNLFFGQGTAYLELPSGEHNFDLSLVGRPAIESVLSLDDVTLLDEAAYTIAAYGRGESLRVLALQDDHGTPPAGQFRVRAIHAAPDVGQVDIWNIPAQGTPSPLIQNFNYGTASDNIHLPEGTYTLGVDADEDGVPDLIYDLPAISAGAIVNLYAVSDRDGKVSLFAQLGEGAAAKIDVRIEKAKIRVLHLSPDAPAVDVFANGASVVSGLAFEQGTNYLEVPSGSYDIAVAPAGAGIAATVLSVPSLPLEPKKAYTAVAYNNVGAIRALALEDVLATSSIGVIRVRAIHTAAGVGEVDIWNIPDGGGAPMMIVENLAFGEASNSLELPPGHYTLGIDVNNDATPDLRFNLPTLTGGTIANVFAVGDVHGNVRLLAQSNSGTAMVDPQ